MSDPIDGLSAVNDALCSFSDRWKHDGDYIRCKACNQPQITSYMDSRFPHAEGCKSMDKFYEVYPWRAYLEIISQLNTELKKAANAR